MLKKSFLILILTTLMLMILFLIPCSANSTHTLAEFKFLKQGIPMELVYSTVGEPDEKSHCYVKYTIENSLVLEIYIDNNDSLSYATLLSDDGVRMYLLFNWGNGPIGSRNPINEATNTLQEKNVRMLSDLTYIRRGMKIDTITTRSGEPDAFAGSGLRWSVYKLNHNNLLHIHNFTSERVVLISLQTETAAAYISFTKDTSLGRLFPSPESSRLLDFVFITSTTKMDDIYLNVGYPDKVTLLGATYNLSDDSSLIFNHFKNGQIKQVILKNNDRNYIFIKLPIKLGKDYNGSFNDIYLEDDELNHAKENQLIYKRKIKDFSCIEYAMKECIVREKYGDADFYLGNAACYMLHDGNVLLINYKNFLVNSVQLWTKSGIILSLNFNELNRLSIV